MKADMNVIPKNAPPGPRGHFLFGSFSELQADWYGYTERCARDYGSVVRFRQPWPLKEFILVTDPLQVEQILVNDVAQFSKWRVHRKVAAPFSGSGLFFAEGAAWKRQRHLMQPAFQRARIASYVEQMLGCAEAMVDSWADGAMQNVYTEVVNFTINVAARTLFGSGSQSAVDRAYSALRESNQAFENYRNSRLPLPLTIPTPKIRRLLRSAQSLERTIYAFIEERRTGTEPGEDLLSMLLDARDEEGVPLSDQQIRDEAITIFIAATETAACALAWTLYLLACHPDEAERVRAEVADVVGSGSVHAHHIPLLRQTERVVKESLRLYPPLARFSRETLSEYVLSGYHIAAGTRVVVSPYLAHRNPTYFPSPERFLPSRWTAAFTQSLPKFAYFPFGGGQRLCIGNAFAMSELVTALATIVSRVRFELTGQAPKISSGSLLLPQGGVHLRVFRTKPARAIPMEKSA